MSADRPKVNEMRTTVEHLGSEAREIDARAYDVAIEYLAENGDVDDPSEWLWNNGDFYPRLTAVMEDIMVTFGDAGGSMSTVAHEWLAARNQS